MLLEQAKLGLGSFGYSSSCRAGVSTGEGPLSRSSVLTKRFFSEASLIEQIFAPIHSWEVWVWRGTFVAIWFVLLFATLVSRLLQLADCTSLA